MNHFILSMAEESDVTRRQLRHVRPTNQPKRMYENLPQQKPHLCKYFGKEECIRWNKNKWLAVIKCNHGPQDNFQEWGKVATEPRHKQQIIFWAITQRKISLPQVLASSTALPVTQLENKDHKNSFNYAHAIMWIQKRSRIFSKLQRYFNCVCIWKFLATTVF